jgi:hypothetical protein
MDKLESKLNELELLLIEDGYNTENIVLRTFLDVRKEAINYTRCSLKLPSRIEIDSEITDILGRYTLGAKPTPKQDELNDIEKGFRICIEWLKNR